MPWILSALNLVFVRIKIVLQNLAVAFSVHFQAAVNLQQHFHFKLLLIVTV